MKRLLILVSVAVMVLALGSAYAAEKDLSWGLSNGVTVFEPYPAPTYVAATEVALDNGITIFEPIISTARSEYGDASGSAAGGMAAENLYNGVTVFNPE